MIDTIFERAFAVHGFPAKYYCGLFMTLIYVLICFALALGVRYTTLRSPLQVISIKLDIGSFLFKLHIT